MAPGLDGGVFVSHHGFMFVRLVRKKNDHVSIRIVENVKKDGKVKQETVCCVGHFHKDNTKKIETHRRIGEEMIVKIKNEIRPALPGLETAVHAPKKRNKKEGTEDDWTCSYKHLKEESRVRVGIDDVFSRQYEQLGLLGTIDSGYKKERGNRLLRDMVVARIDKPSSKRKSVMDIKRDRNLDGDGDKGGGEGIGLDGVYRMMDKLGGREGWVQDRVAARTLGLFGQKIDVAFFDVTTLYFESFVPDGLRISGYSKDNKVKETQVVFALMTTTAGLPLGYELFPGNTYEGGTLIGAVEALGKRYGIAETSVVADRAMFTEKNLGALDEKGIRFIVSAKMRTMKKAATDGILDDVAEFLKEDAGGKTAHWTGEYGYGGRRLVVGYDRKRASKDKKDRERLLERVKKKLRDGKVRVSDLVKNTGTKKYLKFDRANKETAVLDDEKIKAQERWDGVYGIMTSHDRGKVGGEEVFARYRGLWQVEDAFRVNKHDLRMRPVFHWTPGRVKAHILICYMAYALVAVARYRLKEAGVGLSVERIRQELGYVQASVVRDAGSGRRFLLPSKATDLQRAVYGALGLTLEEKVRYLK